MPAIAWLGELGYRRPVNDPQARIYQSQPRAYERLIAAEDCDAHLRRALGEILRPEGATWIDVGAGTGRLARWLGAASSHVHLVDRAAAMLELARDRLHVLGHDRFTIHVADARELPLADRSVDAAAAGWVFGHFRHWMPDLWRDDVDRAIREMRRVVRPGGPIVVIETLGTNHEAPRAHAALDEYFGHLELAHGFTRSWVRTDYLFGDADEAASACEPFFGAEMAAAIRQRGTGRVPECTAIFVCRA